MPMTDEGPLAARGRAATGPRFRRLTGPAAVTLGMALGLAACMPLKDAVTSLGDASPPAAAAAPGPAGQPRPIALAPGLTGAPPPAAASAHAAAMAAAPIAARPLPPPPKPAAAPPAVPVAVHPAPPPAPPPATAPPPDATEAAAPRAAPPDKPCPPSTFGMWSPPDVIGQSVYVCRAQAAPPPR